MRTTTKKIRSLALHCSMLLAAACTTNKPDDHATQHLTNGWAVHHVLTKQVENYTFTFPGEGLAYERRDSLVEACMGAIHRNMELLQLDTFNTPYKIKFHPSKAAMKAATNIGVSGHADYWTKEVGLVVTDDPVIIETENIIPAPIAHETMHMLAMEHWGFPPQNNLWLNEGLATYAANQCNGRTVREVYSYLLSHNKALPMDTLVQQFYESNEMVAYHQAGCIVQYLLEHHGLEKFGSLWQEGAAHFEGIYGMGYAELNTRLNADIMEAYPQGVELDWEVFGMGCK
jgi:hypothetical protein